jgi:transcriptional regulator with XRE-family HTH domain
MSSMVHVALSAYQTEPVSWSGHRATSLALMLGETERRERFAYALQRALTARGMSERQLALAIEVDPRTVTKWRSGRSLPDLYQTLALAATLRVSEDLFRDPPAVPPEPYYPIDQYLVEAAQSGVDEGLRRARSVPASPIPDKPLRSARRSPRGSGAGRG